MPLDLSKAPNNLALIRRSADAVARIQQRCATTHHRVSAYHGVCWRKNKQKWVVSISTGSKKHFIGYFHDQEEAARAYAKAHWLNEHGLLLETTAGKQEDDSDDDEEDDDDTNEPPQQPHPLPPPQRFDLSGAPDTLPLVERTPQQKRGRGRPPASKYFGVSKSSYYNKWCAQIKHKGRVVILGFYDSQKEAALACAKAKWLEEKGKFRPYESAGVNDSEEEEEEEEEEDEEPRRSKKQKTVKKEPDYKTRFQPGRECRDTTAPTLVELNPNDPIELPWEEEEKEENNDNNGGDVDDTADEMQPAGTTLERMSAEEVGNLLLSKLAFVGEFAAEVNESSFDGADFAKKLDKGGQSFVNFMKGYGFKFLQAKKVMNVLDPLHNDTAGEMQPAPTTLEQMSAEEVGNLLIGKLTFVAEFVAEVNESSFDGADFAKELVKGEQPFVSFMKEYGFKFLQATKVMDILGPLHHGAAV